RWWRGGSGGGGRALGDVGGVARWAVAWRGVASSPVGGGRWGGRGVQ
ncbi:hypothetical protein HGQ98_33700, partial [Achromobacter ruhlandii]|nr:hypothetical protein [Achromobacter ruhlandii]